MLPGRKTNRNPVMFNPVNANAFENDQFSSIPGGTYGKIRL